MRRSIFCRIEPPDNLAHLAINRFATWHTWSDAFRTFLVDAEGELRRFPPPPTVRIKRLSDYDYTFSMPPAVWGDASRQKQFESFVQSLAQVRPTARLMLFDKLLGAHLDGQKLHVLFAVMRGALAESAANDFAAMYTPLGNTGDDIGDFPLHADLYVPQYLFNVFDNVPADAAGASTFLAVSSLKRIVTKQSNLPGAIVRRLMSMFEAGSKSDRFEKCFDLLHGGHPWVPQLEQSLAEHQMQIPLRSGQGYLLHDRSWLHGRLKPVGGVPANRVRRLVYGL
jgi:hypothetical protein